MPPNGCNWLIRCNGPGLLLQPRQSQYPELPTWPRYELEQRATMLFNRESNIQNDPNAEERQVWETYAVV